MASEVLNGYERLIDLDYIIFDWVLNEGLVVLEGVSVEPAAALVFGFDVLSVLVDFRLDEGFVCWF